jgi:hypothetical protein
MNISVNTVITDMIEGTNHLILWIASDRNYGYWHNLSSSSRVPKKFKCDEINNNIQDGKYNTDVTPIQIRTEETLSVKEREIRESRWNKICRLVDCEPDIYDKKKRLMLLQSACEEHRVSIDNLYDLLDLYWRSGKSRNALIPAYSNCGAKGEAREKYSIRQTGQQNNKLSGKELSDVDRGNFDYAIRKYYLTQQKRSLKSTYEKLLQDFYTQKPSNGKLKLLESSKIPTFRQFQYWYYKNRDIVFEKKKRDGERSFELNNRAVLGKSDYGLMGPGAQFQVDATIGDVYLVSQYDRSNIIGRPVLYFIMDAFSRMVVGMSVGLEGPSWNALAAAITNMAADKISFCKQYGIEISKSDWPCRHVPASLLGDRGELLSKNADTLVNMFGIRIVNAPPYRADLKGIIEQHFRTINTNAVALLPGSVKPDMNKRGGHDYRLDATLDIRQLTHIIIKCVLYYNNHHYMESFEKSEAMMAESVEAIPTKLWEWGTKNSFGALRVFSEDVVKFAVLPTANAIITEKGIRFTGLYYYCDRAKVEMWFEKARSIKKRAIAISYDPREMTNIYIWDADSKKYDTCYLLDWNSKNAGKTLAEIVYKQKREQIEGKRLKATAIEAKVNLNADIEAIVAEARQKGKSAPVKSKSERVSNIRENRAAERAAIHKNDMADSQNETPAVPQTQSEEKLSPVLRMIKAKAEERLKND